MKLIDSHCHLDKLAYLMPESSEPDNNGSKASCIESSANKAKSIMPRNLGDALNLARNRGVAGFLCVDIDLDNFEAVQSIANTHDDVWCSAGVHPLANLNADKLQEPQLEALALSSPKVVAIGECGLDYHYQKDNRDNQLAVFEKQLRVALAVDKPVIVHTREAQEDTLALLEQYCARGLTGVLHCFTESLAMAERAVELGFYISFSGIITFRNAEPLRQVVGALPLERLLVETDSPYLAPAPHRGNSNQPQWVVEVAEMMASIKGCGVENIARATTANFYQLFNISPNAKT